MNRWAQFKVRLAPSWVLASVAVLLAASLAVGAYDEQLNRAQETQAANVQAQILADTVTAALSFGDQAALHEYASALRANPEVDSVGIFDKQGRLVAGYSRSGLPRQLADTRQPGSAADQIIVVAPVVQDGERLGAVYLRDRTPSVLRRLARYIAPALLVAMACLMFLIMNRDAQTLRRTNRELELQIAERQKAEAALRQSQKMEAVGRLTGGIAHDFNNMLAIVLGSLELMLRRYADADPKMLRFAHDAMEGAKRAAALTQRLLAFSRLQPLKPASVDVGKALNDMTTLLRRTLGEAIQVETVLAGGLWRAYIDQPQLETAILNLAINARDAMPEGGKLTLEAGNAYLDRAYAETEPEVNPGQYVMVAITDTGSGIPADLLAQVFEPFFTTKPTGMGTGLGLSQVQGFVKQSGGHLRLYSEVGEGTTVKLYLPRAMTEPERASPVAAKSAAPSRRDVTVLVAEDEDGVRRFAIEALVDLGYDAIEADGPDQALSLLDANPQIAILLTDVIMPGRNGRLLADEALRRRPKLRVVFMTGYTRNAIVHNGMLDPGTHLLSKPFSVRQLGAELEAVLGLPQGG